VNASQLACGAITTVELVPSSAPGFDVVLAKRSDAHLQFSDLTADALLRVSDSAWTVVGSDRGNSEKLQRIRDRNLPRVAWIASVDPRGKNTERVLLQVHEFPSAYDWQGETDFGVDEKIVEQVRQKLGRRLAVDDVTAWLNERFLLPIEGSTSRAFISGTATPRADQRSAFRLHGRGFAADMARAPDERLLVTRLVEAKRRVDERRPIVLLSGHLSFRDVTIAGEFRGVARTELDQLVAQAGSYLNIWRGYNERERESVLHRARTLGWVRYSNSSVQGDGRWRFRIEGDEKLERFLDGLRVGDNVVLEAAASPPNELQGQSSSDVDDAPGGEPRPRVFVGNFAGGDVRRRFIDLQPSIDSYDREPDERGVLFLSVSGDRKRLERREQAQTLIAAAECPMPQLGLLLEGSVVPERRRKTESPLSPAARAVFGGDPTPRQVEALRIALNTPDIALIQGPPGTGKTRTIAALQVRLAELSEGDHSGQTLLTSYQHDAVENAASKTIVFGLPAVKVGRKRGTIEESNSLDRWRRERVDAVRSDLAALPERPVSQALRRVRTIVAGYMASPLAGGEHLRVVNNVRDLCQGHLAPALMDRLDALRRELADPHPHFDASDDDDRSLALKAVRSLRTDAVSFADDGPMNARRVLTRIQRLWPLETEAHDVLRAASEWEGFRPPPFLDELRALQDQLIDDLTVEKPIGAPRVHDDLESLLAEVVDALYTRARESFGGEDTVLHEYLNDLENDLDGVRDTVMAYTAVLAATCQQSVSYQMSQVKDDGTVFTNVIVDEAARANPLDLAIPMARAERRIILVGDHRQLPHLLEPDIERELEQSSSEATQRALRESLFERLFESMKKREEHDGIKRTVTLNVQYRMHPLLGDFVNDTFYAPYGEAFTSGRSEEEFIHELPGYEGAVAAWVDIPLSRGRERGAQSKHRTAEAEWIAGEVERLATVRRDLSFGVISFYAAQVDEILKAMKARNMSEQLEDGSYRVKDSWRETRSQSGVLIERLRVGTVDAFQGKEFDVVFLSMTRSNPLPIGDERSLRRKYGHLMLENRLCVAMSRQQRLLVVVGDGAMLDDDEAAKAVRGLVAFHGVCRGENGIAFSA
jgi:hypothetical protein